MGATESPSLRAAREERIGREYRELRASDPDLFRQCVEAAEGIMLNRHRELAVLSDADRSNLGAAIEQAIVYIAIRARARHG
jgi:hypothetical protein